MIHDKVIQKAVPVALLVVSLLLLLGAGQKSYKVYELEEDEFGILTFHKVNERGMVIDATFSGVDRVNGRLITTYDRLAGPGKRACPT